MYDRLKEGQFLCFVCQETSPQLYSVAHCTHRFCRDCSTTYISSQASNFAAAKCLQEGCGAPLDKSLPIYQFLDQRTISQLQKYQTFMFLQEHPGYVVCKARNCTGTFRLKKRRCDICSAVHCIKCGQISHQGLCQLNKEESEMTKLHLKRCPSCRVWVQRSQGCRFITCKCGTDFCFTCGELYSKDPCRKRTLWQNQLVIKQQLSKIQCPITCKRLHVFLFKLILAFTVTVIFAALFTAMLCIYLALGIVASLFIPIFLYGQLLRGPIRAKKICQLMLGVIFYPAVAGTMMGLFISISLMYPFCRNNFHHGIYDPFDTALSFIAVCFTKSIAFIMSWPQT